ncbi:MAG: molybdopterin-dependent oxidoreductase [Acidobacteriota bacterium]|nr:molybdopterin-dependent oxidoreductase [Acidobacteriota bacterium]
MLTADRRSFLKWSGAVAGTTALVGTGATLAHPRLANADPGDGMADADRTVWSACMVNCGARCPLRLQVKDGTVVRVLADNTGDDTIGLHRIPACPRGRSIRHRVYNPARLQTPLKRKTGTKRGENQWEEISWEQALDEIAEKYRQILADYGPESIHLAYGTGVVSGNITQSYFTGGALARFLNLNGGFLGYYGDYSTGGITEAMRLIYGTYVDGNSSDDLVNTRLLVLWGHSPMETKMSGGSEVFYLQQLKQRTNVPTVVVDPRYSDSAQLLADVFVSPLPGTDAALVAGVAHVLLAESLHDQAFLDQYCIGFDDDHLPEGAPKHSSYRAYVEGNGPDGIEKTPQWASRVTGVPVDQIISFARLLGHNKPSMIQQGWGPQRHANGENQARAIITLNAMLGNVGVRGGGTGTFTGGAGLSMAYPFDSYSNPVTKKISHFSWLEAIDRGAEMRAVDGVRDWDANGAAVADPKLDVPLKAVWAYGSNILVNQHSEINHTYEVLGDEEKCELIVVIDMLMTSSAKLADYVLPGTSNVEESDVVGQGLAANMGYTIVTSKAIEPLYESRGIYEIASGLAERFGQLPEFTEGKTQEEWVRETIETSREKNPEMPAFDQLKEMGVWKKANPTRVALREFRENPEGEPLGTASGKIELYSAEVEQKKKTWRLPEGDVITTVAEHIDTWESAAEADRFSMSAPTDQDAYPLQMIGYHFKGRTHSSYGNVDWLMEAHTQVVWINPLDAETRGIANGDQVLVFNDRGKVQIEAKVTPRIMPGVVSIPEGAWYTPDADGLDTGGCANTLTRYRPTALAKSNPQYTNLVEVRQA